MARSRRRAREAALQALYESEVGRKELASALQGAIDVMELDPGMGAYARRIAEGVERHREDLDGRISVRVECYDYDRLAAIDRNVMRMAAYELWHEPAVPPAVTINEAIEIARKYSTAESGRFVNGILGRLVQESPKANWDPATAPMEEEPEDIVREAIETPEIEMVDAESDEAKRLAKVGGWRLRADEPAE